MKKLLAVILVLTMLLSLAACGGNGGKDVKQVEAPTLTYLYNTSDSHKAIGEYLQSALQTAGITMNLQNQEWNTFLETRKNGEYSVARNGWLADYNDPISFLDMWTSGSGNNDVQYGKGAHADLKMYNLDLTAYGLEDKVENGTWAETYDVLIQRIKACTDSEARYAMMHLAEDMLMETGCIVPLYYYTDLYMIDESVNGFYSNPLGYKYFMNTDVAGKTDSISVCLASEPQTLDPALNSAVDGATTVAHLFSGLAKWAQDAEGKLVIAPDAAEALPEGVVNEDGTVTYTYKLRSGMKWSNGDEVKASDFVNSWNRAASTELAADYGYMFEIVDGYAEMQEDATKKLNAIADDAAGTITITIENAVNYWNELLAFPTYYPVHSSAFGNEAWATDPSTYICNGPYTMASWDHNSVITLKKNPNYFAAADVKMEEIKMFLSDDANNMLSNFKNGSWLLIDDVPTNEIATLKKDYANEFVVAGQIGTYYVCWNINEDLLPGSELTGVEKEKAQQEIRNAIALLFDRSYIVNDIAQGGELPASSFVAMGMTDADGSEFYKNAGPSEDFDGYYDISEDSYAANCQKAVEVLKKYYSNITA
ncbi:MAG: peptide ABC transporter substrate-binding protein [Ruminococcaceae bacterium]|nr:peptide ABC transporter substrate-binding protein [Oscillospiraceae bacterium]